MIQLATVLPTVSVGPVPPELRVAGSGVSGFALALSSLLVPVAGVAGRPGRAAAPEAALPALQAAAEPGKELPEIGVEVPREEGAPQSDSETANDAPAEQDPAFAWFALPAPPVINPPVAIALGTVQAERVATPEISAPLPRTTKSAIPHAVPVPAGDPSLPVEAEIATPQRPVPVPVPVLAQSAVAAVPQTERDSLDIPHAASPVDPETPATSALVPVPTSARAPGSAPAPAPAQPQPVAASQPSPATAWAPAIIAAAAVEAAVPPERGAARSADAAVAAAPAALRSPAPPAPEIAHTPALAGAAPAAPPIVLAPLRRSAPLELDQPAVIAVAAPGAAAPQQVAAAPETQQGALDMRRQEWIGQMVERIETLRDAAPIRETRIALLPDALGKVDVSVRHDGERVHVHFTAETQAARQILSDAHPRLTELAESRGVRLGQTSMDSGQAGANPHSGPRHDGARPQTPSAPPPARAETELTATEARVA